MAATSERVPDTLAWDLYLGPRAARPYSRSWVSWSQWRDFGTGQLGNWGSHAAAAMFHGLKLDTLWDAQPSFESRRDSATWSRLSQTRIRVRPHSAETNAHCFPTWEMIDFEFPARGNLPPIRYVNNAWRAMLVGTFSLVKGDVMCYSAQNQYEKLYVGEGSDAIRSLLLWGYRDDVRRMIPPVLEPARQGLMYHRAGIKLQLLNHYFWLTRDAEYIRAEEHRWLPEVQRVRVPSGWNVAAASSAQSDLPVDKRGTVDLSNMRGKRAIRFEVNKTAE